MAIHTFGNTTITYDETKLTLEQTTVLREFELMKQHHEQIMIRLLGQILSTCNTTITIKNG